MPVMMRSTAQTAGEATENAVVNAGDNLAAAGGGVVDGAQTGAAVVAGAAVNGAEAVANGANKIAEGATAVASGANAVEAGAENVAADAANNENVDLQADPAVKEAVDEDQDY